MLLAFYTFIVMKYTPLDQNNELSLYIGTVVCRLEEVDVIYFQNIKKLGQFKRQWKRSKLPVNTKKGFFR